MDKRKELTLKKTVIGFIFMALCIIGLSLPNPVSAHDGGGGGGGGNDGRSTTSRSSSFGGHGPQVEPIKGIEGFPTISLDGRGGWSPTDSPERHSPTKQTPDQQLHTLKQKLIGMLIEDLWKDKLAAAALASIPPVLAAYKAVDTLSKVATLTAMAAQAIDLHARSFRAPYTKAAAGMMGSGITFSHPEGHSHPEGGCGLNPNTPMYNGTGGAGPQADMVPDFFWN